VRCCSRAWRLRRAKSGLSARPFTGMGWPSVQPRLGKRLAARRPTGMEVVIARPPFLLVARCPLRRAMPVSSGIIVAPLTTEHDQRNRDTLLDDRRRSVIAAISRVSGVGITRCRRIATGRIPRLGVSVTVAGVRGGRVTAAQWQKNRGQPKFTAHVRRLHFTPLMKTWSAHRENQGDPGDSRFINSIPEPPLPHPATGLCRNKSHRPRRMSVTRMPLAPPTSRYWRSASPSPPGPAPEP